jgi:hypothetical protein
MASKNFRLGRHSRNGFSNPTGAVTVNKDHSDWLDLPLSLMLRLAGQES